MSDKLFTIVKNEKLGRYLIATRDINPGEIIIEEFPIILGPSFSKSTNHEDFVCLSCYARISTSSVLKCQLCTLNSFCSDKCTKCEIHLRSECLIFQKTTAKRTTNVIKINNLLNPQDTTSRKLLYNITILIRGLFCLKRDFRGKWKQIEKLESKVEAFEQVHAFEDIDPIIDELNWDDFDTQDEISQCEMINENVIDLKRLSHQIIGAMRNNAFSHFSSKVSYEGLYFLSSFMAHSCLLNTDRQFDDQGTMTVKAATKILLGQPITTTYISLLGNSSERRRELETNWLFVCQCPRCQDPTDFCTFLGTIRCPGCKQFLLIPHDWICRDKKCSFSQRPLERDLKEDLLSISRFIMEVEQSKPGVGEIDQMENWLLKYNDEKLLPRTHSIFLQIKSYLCQVYGKSEGENIQNISLDKLKRKHEFSSQVTNILDIILPKDGIFQLKGRILFEFWTSLRELQSRNIEEMELNPNVPFSSFLPPKVPEIPFEETIDGVRIKALKILSYAIPGSNDASMASLLKECY